MQAVFWKSYSKWLWILGLVLNLIIYAIHYLSSDTVVQSIFLKCSGNKVNFAVVLRNKYLYVNLIFSVSFTTMEIQISGWELFLISVGILTIKSSALKKNFIVILVLDNEKNILKTYLKINSLFMAKWVKRAHSY